MLINEIENGEEYFIIEPGVLRFGNVGIVDKFEDTDKVKSFNGNMFGSLYLKLREDPVSENSQRIRIQMDTRLDYTSKIDGTIGSERYDLTRELPDNKYDFNSVSADDIIDVLGMNNIEKDDQLRFYITKDSLVEMKQHIDTILKTILS